MTFYMKVFLSTWETFILRYISTLCNADYIKIFLTYCNHNIFFLHSSRLFCHAGYKKKCRGEPLMGLPLHFSSLLDFK